MISFFNRIGNTWVARAIFAALGISMLAFFGLGGIGNTSGSDTTAIQVGKHKISLSELAREFESERAQLSQTMMQYVSPQKAIEMGVLQSAVQKKIADVLSQEIQDELGLAASNQAVGKYVERHPVFRDALGNFDRNLFMAYLAQTRLSEAQLAEQLKGELAQQHLSNTIRFASSASKTLAQMIWKKQNELRDIEALVIETDQIPVSTQPTQEELKDYYEAYLTDFMIAETRDIELLNLTPDTIAKTIQIPEERVASFYEEQKDSYAAPERRHILQMRFSTQDAAQRVKDGLTAQNFLAKAAENGQTMAETDFGVVSRTEVLTELADVAFSAAKNTILGPVESPVGWHLMVVTDIQPAVKPNKNEVYADIKRKLVMEEAYYQMNERVRALEDLLGEGTPLKEAASRLGLSSQSFRKVDISAASLPESLRNNELMQYLFTLKEKEVTPLMEQGEGYLVAEVESVYPVHAKSFDEVVPELKKIWRAEQQKERLQSLTQTAIEQMKAGSIPAKLGRLVVLNKVSQKGTEQLPQEAVDHIFTQKTGYENAVVIPVEKGAVMSVVKRVHVPPMEEGNLPDQLEQLSAENADALYRDVMAAYAEKLGVKVNTAEIQRAFAAYQTE